MMGRLLEGLPRLLVLLAVATSSFAGAGYAAKPSAAFYDNFDNGVADRWAVGQGEWGVASAASSLITSVKLALGRKKSTDIADTYCQANSDIYGMGLDLAQGGRMASYIKGSNYGDFDATVDAVVVSSPTRQREMAIIFRARDLQNFYHFRWYTGNSDGDDHMELWKYVNGTAVLLKQIHVDAMPVGTRAVFKLSARGDQLRGQVLAKGAGTSSSKPLSVTDSTYASGLFALDTYYTAGCFDNVRISS